jgi:hypothetical protein
MQPELNLNVDFRATKKCIHIILIFYCEKMKKVKLEKFDLLDIL